MKPSGLILAFALGGALILCAILARTLLDRSEQIASLGIRAQGAMHARQPRVDAAQDASRTVSVELGDEESDEPTTAASLSGNVYDADGQPVPGVLVTLASGPRHGTTTTDAEGSYWFEELNPGIAEITVALDPEAEWYAPEPARVMLHESSETAGVDFRLVRGLSIVGFVQNDASEPLDDVNVSAEILLPSGTTYTLSRKTAYTDETGFFEIKSINPSAKLAKLALYATGYTSQDILPSQPFEVLQEITLKKQGEVLLLGFDGASTSPLKRFRYYFESPTVTSDQHFTTWTEASILEKRGEARVRNVPPGEWHVTIEELTEIGNPTGRTAVTSVTVTTGEHAVPMHISVPRP
jgi:hypothetical protein